MEFLLSDSPKFIPLQEPEECHGCNKRHNNTTTQNTRILSFDCANKSLAYFSANFDLQYLSRYIELRNKVMLSQQKEAEHIEAIANLLFFTQTNTFAENIKSGVVDVLDGKKLNDTNLIERTKGLKQKLDEIYSTMPTPDLILIEAQPNKNHKSSTVQDQLCMYFINKNIKCMLIDSREKNRHCFDPNLHHDIFVCKFHKTYTANKNHSKQNFLKFIKVFNIEHVLLGIKAENVDDLADSFMQLFAYLLSLLKTN